MFPLALIFPLAVMCEVVSIVLPIIVPLALILPEAVKLVAKLDVDDVCECKYCLLFLG